MSAWSLRTGALAVALLLGRAAHGADEAVPLDEHTALMVGGGVIKIGALGLEYGLTDAVSIGTDTLGYVARATTAAVLAPNAHVKVALARSEGFVLSTQASVYYALATGANDAQGHGWIVPISLFASGAVFPRLWLHGELSYTWVRAVGAGDIGRFGVGGSVATRSGQVGLMAEVPLSRVVSLVARGRVQAFSSPLVLRGTGEADPYTRIEVGAEARTTHPHTWMAVAGVAMTWRHLGLLVGGGYGELFIPGANMVVPGRGFVPEGSIWVSF
jgi:hypothetical protein